MEGNEPNNIAKEEEDNAKSYAHSGNIMLIVIAILFVVVVVMISLHMYARWYLLRARRNQQLLRHNRPRSRTHFVFYMDPLVTRTAVTTVPSRGLDASVIASLPVFAYFQKTHPEPVQCAVCLSEFQEGETGRVLPGCNHSFHIECIDMWFHSHTTCPLCRAPVEPEPANDDRPEMVVTVCEPGSSSGLCVDYQQGGEEQSRTRQVVPSSSSPSIGYLRKPSSHVGVSIEVPRRSESFGDLLGCDSPSTRSSFRLPMSRMLSFKRILSRERKTSVSPSSGSVVGCSSKAELDAERGGRDETQFVESDDVALVESKSYPNSKRTHTGGISGA